MARDTARRRLRGVDFVVDGAGERRAVLIDLWRHRQLWEDFYDAAVVAARMEEPRETLAQVKGRVLGVLVGGRVRCLRGALGPARAGGPGWSHCQKYPREDRGPRAAAAPPRLHQDPRRA
jgi:hypothetical protein